MANGEPGTLDLLRQLRPYEWAQLVGTGLQGLGVGRPGQRVYPFGPLAVLGGGLGQAAERNRRRQLLGQAAAELSPEYAELFGPLAETMPTGQFMQLLLNAQAQQREQEATQFWPQLYAPPPPETVLLEGEYLPPPERAEFEVGRPGVTAEVPGTLTMSEYMRRLGQVPARYRPSLRPPSGLPLEAPGPAQARAGYQLYRGAGFEPEEAATATQAEISGAVKPGQGLDLARRGRAMQTLTPALQQTRTALMAAPDLTDLEKQQLSSVLDVIPHAADPIRGLHEFNQGLLGMRRELRQAQTQEARLGIMQQRMDLMRQRLEQQGEQFQQREQRFQQQHDERMADRRHQRAQAEEHFQARLTQGDHATARQYATAVLQELHEDLQETDRALWMAPENRAAKLAGLRAEVVKWRRYLQGLPLPGSRGTAPGPPSGQGPVSVPPPATWEEYKRRLAQ